MTTLNATELRKYFPQAITRTGSYRQKDGSQGQAVTFYQLTPGSDWINEQAAARQLLTAKVKANQAKAA